MPCVTQNVVRVVVEVDAHRIAGRLILATALDVDAGLRRMRAQDLAYVVIKIESRVRVLIRELRIAVRSADARADIVGCVPDAGNAAEGDVDELRRRIREWRLPVEAEAAESRRVRVGRIERQVVLAAA